MLAKYKDGIYLRVFSYNKNSKAAFAVGIILSIINGLVYPAFSIFLSKILSTLFKFKSDPVGAREDANIAALAFLFLAIGSFIIVWFQNVLFGKVGNEITSNIR